MNGHHHPYQVPGASPLRAAAACLPLSSVSPSCTRPLQPRGDACSSRPCPPVPGPVFLRRLPVLPWSNRPSSALLLGADLCPSSTGMPTSWPPELQNYLEIGCCGCKWLNEASVTWTSSHVRSRPSVRASTCSLGLRPQLTRAPTPTAPEPRKDGFQAAPSSSVAVP